MLYGTSGKPENTANCREELPNTRTISCLPGFYAIAPDERRITLIGNATFNGCRGTAPGKFELNRNKPFEFMNFI